LQTILNLHKTAPDVISLQLDIGLKEVNKIIQNALLGEDGKKISTKLATELEVIDQNSAINTTQSSVWRALKSKPGFTISFGNTQPVWERFAESKVMLAVLHIDNVDSTRLSMKHPTDRFATIDRSFYQEMSMMISTYAGTF
jgi:adenylate cyclase